MHWLKNSRLFPQRRQIVCLANSRKYGGHCVAGKEYLAEGKAGAWIRPVGKGEFEEISDSRQRLGLARRCVQPLDVISIPFGEPTRRFAWQTENIRIGWGRWRKTGRVEWRDLAGFVDEDADLWLSDARRSSSRNDRIKASTAKRLKTSLCLIRPRRLGVRIDKNRFNGRRQFRGLFTYRSHRLNLAITDHQIPRKFFDAPDGVYPVNDCYLCISLGEPIDGFCYRLIASVITKP